MAQKFEADIQQSDDLTVVKLAGILDEDNELLPLSRHIRGDTAVVKLASVRSINNCGVRDWVRWLEEIQAKGTAVVLLECSPAIVAQLNQVSNFAGDAFVKSFYLPYFCQACDKEKAILVDMDEFAGMDEISAPTCRCDGCDGVMAFDDLEESYFAFLREVRRTVPPALQQIIERIVPAGGERKILSRDEITGSSFTGIPSTSRDSFVGSGSIPSATALRRLRGKSGLRTSQRSSEDAAGSSLRRRKLLLFGLAGVGLAAVATALLMMLR